MVSPLAAARSAIASAVVLPHLLEIGVGIARSRPRKYPMQIGVSQRTDSTGSSTLFTRCILSGAQQALRRPKGEALLSHLAAPWNSRLDGSVPASMLFEPLNGALRCHRCR